MYVHPPPSSCSKWLVRALHGFETEHFLTLLLLIALFSFSDTAEAITVDDLLPALIFLIIKSDIPNWLVLDH